MVVLIHLDRKWQLRWLLSEKAIETLSPLFLRSAPSHRTLYAFGHNNLFRNERGRHLSKWLQCECVLFISYTAHIEGSDS